MRQKLEYFETCIEFQILSQLKFVFPSSCICSFSHQTTWYKIEEKDIVEIIGIEIDTFDETCIHTKK